jgi:hypothetical protein
MHAYECKRHAFNTADWTVMPQCCARRLQFNAPFPPPPLCPTPAIPSPIHTYRRPWGIPSAPEPTSSAVHGARGWVRRGRRARRMFFRGGASSSRRTKSPSTSWASPVGQCLSMPSCFGSTAATRPSPSLRLPRSRHPRAQTPLISRARRRESRRPEPQRRPAAGAHDTVRRRLARPLVAAS